VTFSTSGAWSLAQYREPGTGGPAVGFLTGDTVHAGLDGFAGLSLLDLVRNWDAWVPSLAAWKPDDTAVVPGARLLAPLTRPGKVVCVAANYRDHLQEMGIRCPVEPADTFFFLKPPTAVTGPGAPVPLPSYAGARVDWEAELAVVIGRRARHLTAGQALDHLAGYLAANDISARDRFTAAHPLAPPFAYDWLAHKGQDGFCPLGPGLVPAWHIPDPQDLSIRLTVNGVTKQDSHTREMILTVAETVAAASALMTLEPGDVLLTGTPAGCGAPRGEFLRDGDTVIVEIERIGTLMNVVTGSG